MSAHTEASSKKPDNGAEITSQEYVDDVAHQGGTSGDPTTGPSNSYPQVIPPHDTPQQTTYYGSHSNSQITPDSPSPNINGRTTYNGGSFFQAQPAAGFQTSPFTNDMNNPYTGGPSTQPPLSPTQSMGGIPPASPLFPRMVGQIPSYLSSSRGGDSGLNPGMSPVPSGYSSSGGMYIPVTYPILAGRPSESPNNNNNINNNSGNEEFMVWNDNRNTPYSLQPGQGVMPFVPGMPPRPDRSPSFEDPGIPHSSSDSSSNAYGAGAGPQGWGYGAPPTDAYGNNSNLSQRPSGPYPGQQGGQYRHPPQFAGPYGGHYGFPTTSPGPPIQTTSSNKGPDGANLFIFHIPNHFTNLDMYHLFSPYGNLLSVRIMVEKDSGRSRGFGFVSYDNPDAAALAIKELNGFAIGNKRLKVQHKQIRPSDQQEMGVGGPVGHMHGGGRGRGGRGPYNPGRGSNNLPPMPSTGWYNTNNDGQPIPTTGGVVDESQHVRVVLGDNPSNSTNVTTVDPAGNSPVAPGQDEHQTSSDPLSSMDPLRQTLPDIGGVATPPVSGDN